MNAIQFIKEHGVEKAREVVEGAPEWATGINLNSLKYFGGDCFCRGDLLVSGLKRLVESVDYVAIHGYEKSKEILKNAPSGAECYSWSIGNSGVRDKTVELAKLKQAIADYESIYSDNNMGDDSHIENHVSPLCKVGVK